ncbi:restriction endonuclease (plasmid) [Nocardia pseudovaccinii]|uniref:restriction endonuclease n=1 Tax=Nocardia pseudovaccinii TaxID=189540 RepID=UPI003D8AAE22
MNSGTDNIREFYPASDASCYDESSCGRADSGRFLISESGWNPPVAATIARWAWRLRQAEEEPGRLLRGVGMGRRRGRRGSNAAAFMFMAAVAALVVAPKVADIAQQQAVILGSVGACALAVAAVAAALAVLHRRRVRARDDARVLAALRQNSLSPSEFEEALAALCRRDGCTDVRVVGGSGDLGADVIARAPDGRRIVLQAKRYRNGRSVGSQDVQRFGGTAHTIHGADVAAVVTQARAYAAKAGILLMPAKALAAWESQTGPTPWN